MWQKQKFSRRRHAKQQYIPPEDEKQQQQQHEQQKYMYIDTTKLTHTHEHITTANSRKLACFIFLLQ